MGGAPAANQPGGRSITPPANFGRGTLSPAPGNGNVPNPAGRGTTPNPSGPGSAPNTFGRGANPGPAPNTFGRGANPGSAPNTFGRGNAPGPAGRGNIPDAARPRVFQGANGANAHFNPAGRPTVVQTRGGATIIHAPSGAQRIEVVRPGGRVFVTNPAGHGYVQRPIMVRGRPFVQRTYIGGGRAYPQFYRQSVYRGITFSVYTPTRFYSPRFYSWAYTPWRSPIYYNFGWGGAPWFGFYGGYFNPYPTYAGPNYWLTDYLLAASLQEAYQERMDASAAAQAGYDPSGQAVLSPQVKALVAAEVQRQLNQESAESQNPQALMSPSNGAPPILADSNPHVFVVGSSLIANAGGQECALTQGDVLQLNPAPSPDPNYANVQVLASKGRDCQTGNLIPVQLADLQEMQNHMRATLDRGLGELQTGQGKGGLPPIDPSLQAQTQAPYAADLPAAESDAADQLKQQAQQATQQQQDVLGQAGQAGASAPTIQLGQSVADVVALLGNPSRIADLGQKKTYFYQDMKVIFVDGRVSDVQ